MPSTPRKRKHEHTSKLLSSGNSKGTNLPPTSEPPFLFGNVPAAIPSDAGQPPFRFGNAIGVASPHRPPSPSSFEKNSEAASSYASQGHFPFGGTAGAASSYRSSHPRPFGPSTDASAAPSSFCFGETTAQPLSSRLQPDPSAPSPVLDVDCDPTLMVQDEQHFTWRSSTSRKHSVEAQPRSPQVAPLDGGQGSVLLPGDPNRRQWRDEPYLVPLSTTRKSRAPSRLRTVVTWDDLVRHRPEAMYSPSPSPSPSLSPSDVS